jgi:hypothetical protein
MCVNWSTSQDWDNIKACAKEHGPEVLLGAFEGYNNVQKWEVVSVLTIASAYKNVEMVKLILDVGFDNKEAMYVAAVISMDRNEDSTILRLLLEHGLDPNIDLRVEGLHGGIVSNLLMSGTVRGFHTNHAKTLLDHGANVNKTVVTPDGDVLSPLICAFRHGEYALCRLFLTRGAIPTTNDVTNVFNSCLAACKGANPRLSRDVAIKMFAAFFHLGKPDADVVRDKFNYSKGLYRDPTITNIKTNYLQGRPFCCEVCEALTAKQSSKLLMCPCRTIAYCSRECQLYHWEVHKVQCLGPLNENGESEALVRGEAKKKANPSTRKKTGRVLPNGQVVGVGKEDAEEEAAEGAVKTGKSGKKGKKGKGKKKK